MESVNVSVVWLFTGILFAWNVSVSCGAAFCAFARLASVRVNIPARSDPFREAVRVIRRSLLEGSAWTVTPLNSWEQSA